MPRPTRHALAVLAIVILLSAGGALAEIPKTPEERDAVMRALDWRRDGGSFHLDGSSSTLRVDPSVWVLLGREAQRLHEAINGTDAPRNLEATVVDPQAETIVTLTSTREGYVRFDDWADVDADAMLADIKDGTAESNKQRIAHNMSPLEVIGWRQKPTLDRVQQTVSWAIEARGGHGALVNASVLTFSRYGYEKLTWAGPGDLDPAALLNQVRDGFRFDQGAQYADFKDGDKIAEYGIAALVASAVGAKVASKLGLLAVAAVFLKKFWVVGIAVVVGLFGALRKKLGRNQA